MSKPWDGEGKAGWRNGFWDYVDRVMPTTHRHLAHAVILPGKEGLEIPLAIGVGILAGNIHAVDENPALIATAPWRKQYPCVRVYGTKLSVAMPRIVASVGGKGHYIRVINLDFCSNLNASLVDELTHIRQGLDGHLIGCVVGVNVLKGREDPMVPLLLAELGYSSRAEWVAKWVVGCGSLSLEEYGGYKDGASPMCWARGVQWTFSRDYIHRRQGLVRSVHPWPWRTDDAKAQFWGYSQFGTPLCTLTQQTIAAFHAMAEADE